MTNTQDFKIIPEFPEMEQWLAECPTAWNIEYSAEHKRECFFIARPDEDIDVFLKSFLY